MAARYEGCGFAPPPALSPPLRFSGHRGWGVGEGGFAKGGRGRGAGREAPCHTEKMPPHLGTQPRSTTLCQPAYPGHDGEHSGCAGREPPPTRVQRPTLAELGSDATGGGSERGTKRRPRYSTAMCFVQLRLVLSESRRGGLWASV